MVDSSPYSAARHPRRRSCRKCARDATVGEPEPETETASISNLLSDWPTRHTVPAAMACTALQRPDAQRWKDLPPSRQAQRPSAVHDVPAVVAPEAEDDEDEEADEDEPSA